MTAATSAGAAGSALTEVMAATSAGAAGLALTGVTAATSTGAAGDTVLAKAAATVMAGVAGGKARAMEEEALARKAADRMVERLLGKAAKRAMRCADRDGAGATNGLVATTSLGGSLLEADVIRRQSADGLVDVGLVEMMAVGGAVGAAAAPMDAPKAALLVARAAVMEPGDVFVAAVATGALAVVPPATGEEVVAAELAALPLTATAAVVTAAAVSAVTAAAVGVEAVAFTTVAAAEGAEAATGESAIVARAEKAVARRARKTIGQGCESHEKKKSAAGKRWADVVLAIALGGSTHAQLEAAAARAAMVAAAKAVAADRLQHWRELRKLVAATSAERGLAVAMASTDASLGSSGQLLEPIDPGFIREAAAEGAAPLGTMSMVEVVDVALGGLVSPPGLDMFGRVPVAAALAEMAVEGSEAFPVPDGLGLVHGAKVLLGAAAAGIIAKAPDADLGQDAAAASAITVVMEAVVNQEAETYLVMAGGVGGMRHGGDDGILPAGETGGGSSGSTRGDTGGGVSLGVGGGDDKEFGDEDPSGVGGPGGEKDPCGIYMRSDELRCLVCGLLLSEAPGLLRLPCVGVGPTHPECLLPCPSMPTCASKVGKHPGGPQQGGWERRDGRLRRFRLEGERRFFSPSSNVSCEVVSRGEQARRTEGQAGQFKVPGRNCCEANGATAVARGRPGARYVENSDVDVNVESSQTAGDDRLFGEGSLDSVPRICTSWTCLFGAEPAQPGDIEDRSGLATESSSDVASPGIAGVLMTRPVSSVGLEFGDGAPWSVEVDSGVEFSIMASRAAAYGAIPVEMGSDTTVAGGALIPLSLGGGGEGLARQGAALLGGDGAAVNSLPSMGRGQDGGRDYSDGERSHSEGGSGGGSGSPGSDVGDCQEGILCGICRLPCNDSLPGDLITCGRRGIAHRKCVEDELSRKFTAAVASGENQQDAAARLLLELNGLETLATRLPAGAEQSRTGDFATPQTQEVVEGSVVSRRERLSLSDRLEITALGSCNSQGPGSSIDLGSRCSPGTSPEGEERVARQLVLSQSPGAEEYSTLQTLALQGGVEAAARVNTESSAACCFRCGEVLLVSATPGHVLVQSRGYVHAACVEARDRFPPPRQLEPGRLKGVSEGPVVQGKGQGPAQGSGTMEAARGKGGGKGKGGRQIFHEFCTICRQPVLIARAVQHSVAGFYIGQAHKECVDKISKGGSSQRKAKPSSNVLPVADSSEFAGYWLTLDSGTSWGVGVAVA